MHHIQPKTLGDKEWNKRMNLLVTGEVDKVTQIKPGVLEKSSLTYNGKIVVKCYPIEISAIYGCFAWRYAESNPKGYSSSELRQRYPEWNGLPDVFGGDDDDLLRPEEVHLDFREYDRLYWECWGSDWNIRKSRT